MMPCGSAGRGPRGSGLARRSVAAHAREPVQKQPAGDREQMRRLVQDVGPPAGHVGDRRDQQPGRGHPDQGQHPVRPRRPAGGGHEPGGQREIERVHLMGQVHRLRMSIEDQPQREHHHLRGRQAHQADPDQAHPARPVRSPIGEDRGGDAAGAIRRRAEGTYSNATSDPTSRDRPGPARGAPGQMRLHLGGIHW